jgi:UDP-N-acetylglucosamine 4,6-dehydratase
MNILVVGGTGTLGRELIKHYVEGGHAVYCLSRDELKQQELKKLYPEVNFILGDVRDGLPLLQADIDILYYVAALKHIDLLETNIDQAIATNVMGTITTAKDAIEMGIPKFAFSSKALGEKYLMHLNTVQSKTDFRVFRWGNVIGSRGSVIHSFAKSLSESRKVNLTLQGMTRFWIKIEDAVRFMVRETEIPRLENPIIPNMKSASVVSIAKAVAERLGISDFDTELTGIRPGEKLHETIELERPNSFYSEYYTHDELVEMLRGVI